jgi:hypothetical protein
MNSVGKKGRKPVTHSFSFGLAASGDRRGYASGSRYAQNRPPRPVGKKDDAIAIPRSAAAIGVTKRLRRTSGDSDAAELVLREKAQRLTVGRPERVRGAFSARERVSVERIHVADPYLSRPAVTGHEGKHAAVG